MTEPLPDPDPASDKYAPRDAMAVDATPDEERTHGDADETDSVTRNDGAEVPVEPDEE